VKEDNFLFALKRDGNELLTLGCEVWSTWDPTKADPYQWWGISLSLVPRPRWSEEPG